ncbi:trafficking protein particle complex subunit 8, putative [Plasmodium malariae]|uniref:Trafficking protein particle complex subunit 8, putative n=1 Tax=Plasmodium malariae TaxID=5858 RepID=A0A1D3JJM7_PLAMA|nr:trafficking protein particle complex subunit 8, putative [Plasmodium malariae]SBT86711.1 trafficking protein particle complex subunit 8, putative [Plasmodium malariae]
MANLIEEEIKNVINDIYVPTILIDSSRIAKREISFFLGISVNDLFQPFGTSDSWINEEKEKVDLKLNVSINLNYLSKHNTICEKVIENKNFKVRFINSDEYKDIKLDYLDKILIDTITYNEPQYNDIYNEGSLNTYFKKNYKDNIVSNKNYFYYLCANSSILNNEIKKAVLKNERNITKKVKNVYNEKFVNGEGSSDAHIFPSEEWIQGVVSPLGNSARQEKQHISRIDHIDHNGDTGYTGSTDEMDDRGANNSSTYRANYGESYFSSKVKYIDHIQKYNAFFLPWFNTYLKTSWRYMHLYNNSSCSTLGIIYICSTRDSNVIELYKCMIKNNIQNGNSNSNVNSGNNNTSSNISSNINSGNHNRDINSCISCGISSANAHANSNIPKGIILLHISNNSDDDIETDVQKLFVNIQSTFLNYKCHLLIIKAHRFLNADKTCEMNAVHMDQQPHNKVRIVHRGKNDTNDNQSKFLHKEKKNEGMNYNNNKSNIILNVSGLTTQGNEYQNERVTTQQTYEEGKNLQINGIHNTCDDSAAASSDAAATAIAATAIASTAIASTAIAATTTNDDDDKLCSSKDRLPYNEKSLTYTDINISSRKNKDNWLNDKKQYLLNNIQKLYVNHLSMHLKDLMDGNIRIAKNSNDIEHSKQIKKSLSTNFNKIYDYIISDEVIYISKRMPLYIDETYFCCCLDSVDIISLKMFIHNFIKTCVIPYITTLTYDINNLILNNKKSLRNQLKFMWRKTKFNFTSSDAALFVAEQTSNVLLNVAQNVLLSNNDTNNENPPLKDRINTNILNQEKEGIYEEHKVSLQGTASSAERDNAERNFGKGDSLQMLWKPANSSTSSTADAASSSAAITSNNTVSSSAAITSNNTVSSSAAITSNNTVHSSAAITSNNTINSSSNSTVSIIANNAGDAKLCNRDSLEWMYKTLSDVYFILNEYELSYNILKICINEFKHDKLYFYLGNIYELISLCIYNMDTINKKDSLYYLDLSYQMYYKCYYLNNMFVCSILNYYLSLIYDENSETCINILINANVDFSCVEEKLTSENKLTKLSFQINNIRSGLLLEQITYSYKKKKKKGKYYTKEIKYMKQLNNSYNKLITNIVNKNGSSYISEKEEKTEEANINNDTSSVEEKKKKKKKKKNLNTQGENSTIFMNSHNVANKNDTINSDALTDNSIDTDCAVNNKITVNDNFYITATSSNNNTKGHICRSDSTSNNDFKRTSTEKSNSGTCAGGEKYNEQGNTEYMKKNDREGKKSVRGNSNILESANSKEENSDSDSHFFLQKNNYKYRKYLFEMTLAGHTFNKCGFKKLALFCYSKVLKKYEKKKMKHIYEHLHFMMARQAFSINLYYEALNHYICILNSISKNYEQSYVLNKNVDIYCASPDKEINFIREFAYVYKIYVDKVLNIFLRKNKGKPVHAGDCSNENSSKNGNQNGDESNVKNGDENCCKNDCHNDTEKPNCSWQKKGESDTHEQVNRMHYFNEDNSEDVIKPLNLKIPLIRLRNNESLFTNSVCISQTNIYNYDKMNDINYFDIFENNLFKIKKYDTTLLDMYNIMMKDINDLSMVNFHEIHYLYISYKKFINSVYNDCIDLLTSDVIVVDENKIDCKAVDPIGSGKVGESGNITESSIRKEETIINCKTDEVKKSSSDISAKEFIKSIKVSPYVSLENKNAFTTYVREFKEKLVNSLQFNNNIQIKNIYQKGTDKEEIKINNKFIQYVSKNDYIFVTFKLINPLHTKVECQSTHICAYYYNENMNKNILVEKKIIILEARQSKTFTLYIKPLKRGLLFVSGVMWHLFGLVKTYQSFYTHGLKKLSKKFDDLHFLKYDGISNCDNNVEKKENLKKLNRQMNTFTWSNNIGMINKKSLKKIKQYDIDHRLVLYVYDRTYSLSFEFENIYSNERKEISSYEVDMIELLEGEKMEMTFKIVNHSTIPVNYISICITPCSLFSCYKVVHNGDEYILNDDNERIDRNYGWRSKKNKEQYSNSEEQIRKYSPEYINYKFEEANNPKNNDTKKGYLFIENDMYYDKFVDKNTSVFKQKFKNKNIQNVKINGNVKKNDVFYLHISVNSAHIGLHRCIITTLCKYKNDIIKKIEGEDTDDDNNVTPYSGMLREKKEKCYLFLRLMHVIPLIKLKVYHPLNSCKRNNTFMYIFFQNLCKREIYLFDLFLEHKKEKNSGDLAKWETCPYRTTHNKFSKIKLFNCYLSEFFFLKKNENLTSLVYTKNALQEDISSFYVHINWFSKDVKWIRRGSLKKQIHLTNDVLTFSIDEINKDIYMNNQKEHIVQIAINIQNNSDIDLTNCYVQAKELEALNSSLHLGNDNDDDDDETTNEMSQQHFIDYKYESEDTYFNNVDTNNFSGLAEVNNHSFNEQNFFSLNGDIINSLNYDDTELHINRKSSNNSSNKEVIVDLNNMYDDNYSDTKKEEKEKEKTIACFSYKTAFNDEINIAETNLKKKMYLSNFTPITASYKCNENFEIAFFEDPSLSEHPSDSVITMAASISAATAAAATTTNGLTENRQFKENCESFNSLEKGSVRISKEAKRFQEIVKYNTYINYGNFNSFVRLKNDTLENEKQNKTTENFVALNGFLFIGIVQKFIKKLKKHQSKKIHFNILFNKEGIYNINRFHVIFECHNEMFIFKPLNQLIVHVHR